MTKKKKQIAKTIFITFFILAGLASILYFGVVPMVQTEIGFADNEITHTADGREILNFCDTRQECVDYLINKKGMPVNFMEEAGLDIVCNNKICESIKK